MKAWDIIGYSLFAAIYCPDCIVKETIRVIQSNELIHPIYLIECISEGMTETTLDNLAGIVGIDRYDERSFDSDYFPKVIFASQFDSENDYCSHCGKPLIGE